MRLKGYVGSSDVLDAICLYLNLEFDTCVYIKRNDILHVQEAPENELEFGGTYVWVRKDAEITHARTESVKEKASFLEGEIAREQVKPSAATAQISDHLRPIPVSIQLGCDTLIPQYCGPIGTIQRSCLAACDPITFPRRSCLIICDPITFPKKSCLIRCDPISVPIRSCVMNCDFSNRIVCELATYNKSCFICPTQIREICEGISGGGWNCPVDVFSAACNDPVIKDPVIDITAQIRELVDQVKAQNAQLKKLAEKGSTG